MAKSFFRKNDQILVLFRRYSAHNQYFESPCHSSFVNILSVSQLLDQIEVAPIESVKGKVYMIPTTKNLVAVPLLHST